LPVFDASDDSALQHERTSVMSDRTQLSCPLATLRTFHPVGTNMSNHFAGEPKRRVACSSSLMRRLSSSSDCDSVAAELSPPAIACANFATAGSGTTGAHAGRWMHKPDRRARRRRGVVRSAQPGAILVSNRGGRSRSEAPFRSRTDEGTGSQGPRSTRG